MASSQTEVRDDIRSITDYDKSVFSDAELDEVIGVAEDDVRGELGDPSLSFYQGEDSFYRDNAVKWLGVLFAKIRSGEIEGITMSAGDLELSSLSAQDTFYFAQYRTKISQSGSPGFGGTRVEREAERNYEYETR